MVVFSCDSGKKSNNAVSWIAGQIVNPKLDYIILAQGKQILDTILLDSNNFFLYRSENIQEGLYTLRHNETQVLYLEPGDSLILHLNTIDFDESLAYSGKGAAKNNLLMDLYLKNERENNDLPKWYYLSPQEFTFKIDSMKSAKERDYKEFLSNNKVSQGFKEVAQTSINYDYYSKKELYAMANRAKGETIKPEFFDYRKNIDFNKEEMRYYYPYYRFLDRYFNSITTMNFPANIDRNSYAFNIDKMHAIDSMISNDSIKNSLLRMTAFKYMLCAKDPDEEENLYKVFSSLNTNQRHLESIKKLTDATIKLAKGNKIPDIPIVSMDNSVKHIHEIVNKPTVLYFWTSDSPEQAKMVHSRAAELKSKYPEYDFYGINTDTHYKKWRQTVKRLDYDPKLEYQLENVMDAEKQLVLGVRSKAIILNPHSIILDGNTNMFHNNFEELLLGFLNKKEEN